MKPVTAFCFCLLCHLYAASSNTTAAPDSVLPVVPHPLHRAFNKNTDWLTQFSLLIQKDRAVKTVLGFTLGGRPVDVYYFPGTSSQNALVIGGVHGSELSSIAVTWQLVQGLQKGEKPFYNVVVIPALFPDNAAQAEAAPQEIGSLKNIGRYTHAFAVDPNRQMPSPGRAFNAAAATDHLGRCMEYENTLLLQLLHLYRPERIVNIHAIRDTAQAGIYADPRTDHQGYALDFADDSSLAVHMAHYIQERGGAAPGNQLGISPTALYYKDPPVARPGERQPRNTEGAALPGGRGAGISLGSWAATAVSDPEESQNNRAAICLLTMEFPGYKRPIDYTGREKEACARQVQLYAGAILEVFLGE